MSVYNINENRSLCIKNSEIHEKNVHLSNDHSRSTQDEVDISPSSKTSNSNSSTSNGISNQPKNHSNIQNSYLNTPDGCKVTPGYSSTQSNLSDLHLPPQLQIIESNHDQKQNILLKRHSNVLKTAAKKQSRPSHKVKIPTTTKNLAPEGPAVTVPKRKYYMSSSSEDDRISESENIALNHHNLDMTEKQRHLHLNEEFEQNMLNSKKYMPQCGIYGRYPQGNFHDVDNSLSFKNYLNKYIKNENSLLKFHKMDFKKQNQMNKQNSSAQLMIYSYDTNTSDLICNSDRHLNVHYNPNIISENSKNHIYRLRKKLNRPTLVYSPKRRIVSPSPGRTLRKKSQIRSSVPISRVKNTHNMNHRLLLSIKADCYVQNISKNDYSNRNIYNNSQLGRIQQQSNIFNQKPNIDSTNFDVFQKRKSLCPDVYRNLNEDDCQKNETCFQCNATQANPKTNIYGYNDSMNLYIPKQNTHKHAQTGDSKCPSINTNKDYGIETNLLFSGGMKGNYTKKTLTGHGGVLYLGQDTIEQDHKLINTFDLTPLNKLHKSGKQQNNEEPFIAKMQTNARAFVPVLRRNPASQPRPFFIHSDVQNENIYKTSPSANLRQVRANSIRCPWFNKAQERNNSTTEIPMKPENVEKLFPRQEICFRRNYSLPNTIGIKRIQQTGMASEDLSRSFYSPLQQNMTNIINNNYGSSNDKMTTEMCEEKNGYRPAPFLVPNITDEETYVEVGRRPEYQTVSEENTPTSNLTLFCPYTVPVNVFVPKRHSNPIKMLNSRFVCEPVKDLIGQQNRVKYLNNLLHKMNPHLNDISNFNLQQKNNFNNPEQFVENGNSSSSPQFTRGRKFLSHENNPHREAFIGNRCGRYEKKPTSCRDFGAMNSEGFKTRQARPKNERKELFCPKVFSQENKNFNVSHHYSLYARSKEQDGRQNSCIKPLNSQYFKNNIGSSSTFTDISDMKPERQIFAQRNKCENKISERFRNYYPDNKCLWEYKATNEDTPECGYQSDMSSPHKPCQIYTQKMRENITMMKHENEVQTNAEDFDQRDLNKNCRQAKTNDSSDVLKTMRSNGIYKPYPEKTCSDAKQKNTHSFELMNSQENICPPNRSGTSTFGICELSEFSFLNSSESIHDNERNNMLDESNKTKIAQSHFQHPFSKQNLSSRASIQKHKTNNYEVNNSRRTASQQPLQQLNQYEKSHDQSCWLASNENYYNDVCSKTINQFPYSSSLSASVFNHFNSNSADNLNDYQSSNKQSLQYETQNFVPVGTMEMPSADIHSAEYHNVNSNDYEYELAGKNAKPTLSKYAHNGTPKNINPNTYTGIPNGRLKDYDSDCEAPCSLRNKQKRPHNLNKGSFHGHGNNSKASYVGPERYFIGSEATDAMFTNEEFPSRDSSTYIYSQSFPKIGSHGTNETFKKGNLEWPRYSSDSKILFA